MYKYIKYLDKRTHKHTLLDHCVSFNYYYIVIQFGQGCREER